MSSSSCSRGYASLRYAVAIAAACAFLMFAPAADAAIPSVFSNTPTPIPCVTQGNGVRLCDQTTFAPGATALARSRPSMACRSTCASHSRPSPRVGRTGPTR